MKFESKKDLWLGLFIWGSMIFGLVITIKDGNWIAIISMVVALMFVAALWFGIVYYIVDDILEIKVGPFTSKIPVKDIKSIKNTRNPISSAALSLDRIQITYGNSRVALISPKDKEEFIKELLKINNNISVKN